MKGLCMRTGKQANHGWYLIIVITPLNVLHALTNMQKKSQRNIMGRFTFLTGCTNRKVSAVPEHEISVAHVKAVEQSTARDWLVTKAVKTPAGKAINLLNQNNRQRMCYLFINVHAVETKRTHV